MSSTYGGGDALPRQSPPNVPKSSWEARGGVARYATNKNEAVKLLEYLASPTGSKGLAAPTFEHPLKEVNQNPIVKNFGEFTPDKVTVEDLGVNNSLAIKLMKDVGWN